MGRKVQFTKEQLNEILGTDIDYLNNGNYKEYNGNSEVAVTGKITTQDKNGRPVTSDQYADTMAPYNFYGFHSPEYAERQTVLPEDIEEAKEFIADIISEQLKKLTKQ